jgi:hypothetical protein
VEYCLLPGILAVGEAILVVHFVLFSAGVISSGSQGTVLVRRS